MYFYMNTYVYACIHIHIYICIQACVCMYQYTYIYTYVGTDKSNDLDHFANQASVRSKITYVISDPGRAYLAYQAKSFDLPFPQNLAEWPHNRWIEYGSPQQAYSHVGFPSIPMVGLAPLFRLAVRRVRKDVGPLFRLAVRRVRTGDLFKILRERISRTTYTTLPNRIRSSPKLPS